MSSRQNKKLKDPQRHAASKDSRPREKSSIEAEEIEKKSLAIDLHYNE